VVVVVQVGVGAALAHLVAFAAVVVLVVPEALLAAALGVFVLLVVGHSCGNFGVKRRFLYGLRAQRGKC
jgi:hypothetical protein